MAIEGSSSSRLIVMLVDAVDLRACFMSRTNERRGWWCRPLWNPKYALSHAIYTFVRRVDKYVLNLKLRCGRGPPILRHMLPGNDRLSLPFSFGLIEPKKMLGLLSFLLRTQSTTTGKTITNKIWESSAHHALAGKEDAATILFMFAPAIPALPLTNRIVPRMI